MSNQDPTSASSTEELQISGRPPRSSTGSARRFFAGLSAAAVAAGAVGAGVWAWQAWADQGAQPAEALPGNTLAYLALDLDPPGGQKVEAFGTLRKFPSLRKELGLDSVDEFRGSVVEELASESGCDLDYDDVKPWIGDRFALAVVAQRRPEPVVVLQVKDADLARTGLEAIGDGCDSAGFGHVVDGEWALLARSNDVANRVVGDAGRGTLDDDSDFRSLTGAAGKPGLVTLYAAPEAGPALLDEIERNPFIAWTAQQGLNAAFDPMSAFVMGLGLSYVAEQAFGDEAGYLGEGAEVFTPEQLEAQAELEKQFENFEELSKKERRRLLRQQDELMRDMYGDFESGVQPGELDEDEEFPEGDFGEIYPAAELPAGMRESLADFSGLGGVARFDDGGLEVEVVSDSIEGTYADLYAGKAGDDIVADLPDDTALAFGAGLGDGWADKLIALISRQFPFSEQTEAEAAAAFEKSTGLDVPGDLEDLGGDAISLMAGSGFSPDELFENPAKAPVAARIAGDPARIEAALEKLRKRIGAEGAARLLSQRVGDDVVVGPNAAYLDHLAKGGSDLGGSDRFRDVAPRADDATAVYFVDFDAGDWLAKLAEAEGDRANAEPLDAFGMTVTKEKGEQRILLRLGFDD